MSLTNDTQCAHCGSDCSGHSYWIGSNGPLCAGCTRSKTEFMATAQSHESFFIKRIRELEAELAVRDNILSYIIGTLVDATGRRGFHNEMEAADCAAKMLADARLDSARLDWLQHKGTTNIEADVQDRFGIDLDSDEYPKHKNLRDAIDAEMVSQ